MSFTGKWKFFLKSEKSLIFTILGVVVLFVLGILAVVVCPSYVDDS